MPLVETAALGQFSLADPEGLSVCADFLGESVLVSGMHAEEDNARPHIMSREKMQYRIHKEKHLSFRQKQHMSICIMTGEFLQALKAAMKAEGVTQGQLATMLRMNQSNVSRRLGERTSKFDIEMLVPILARFQRQRAELLAALPRERRYLVERVLKAADLRRVREFEAPYKLSPERDRDMEQLIEKLRRVGPTQRARFFRLAEIFFEQAAERPAPGRGRKGRGKKN